MAQCSIQLPDGFCDQLSADMHVHLLEIPGDETTNVIRRDQSYRVVVHIELSAVMKRLLCGYWCVSIMAEGAGTAGERKDVKQVEMNNCEDSMDTISFDLSGAWFTPGVDDTGRESKGPCGDVFNLTVTAIALDKCNKEPIGIAGFCTLGPVMVYG